MISLLFPGEYWVPLKDGDPMLSAIFRRHYSCRKYKDGRRDNPNYRNRHLVFGLGEYLGLITTDLNAIFGWRKFISQAGEDGINCAFFRNEGVKGNGRGYVWSSVLILEAERWALKKWPNATRFYTYVNGRVVKGDGKCFKMAGWKKLNRRTKNKGLIILEKVLL